MISVADDFALMLDRSLIQTQSLLFTALDICPVGANISAEATEAADFY